MSSDDFRKKLLSSESVRSLSAEQRIASALEQHRWATVHGFYYKDPKTEKHRELDLVGRQIWFGDYEDERARGSRIYVHLLVECKSLSGYHVVFSPLKREWPGYLVESVWIGKMPNLADELFNRLKGHMDIRNVPRLVRSILKGFEDTAYPNGESVVQGLIPPPIPASVSASAFRETNTKVEKDLDSSVIWRAFQTLQSAVSGLKEDFFRGELDGVATYIRTVAEKGGEVLLAGVDAFLNILKAINIYHPILVLDADLWVLQDGTLQPVPSIRFLQVDEIGFPWRYMDVVQSSAFRDFLEHMTAHYTSHLHASNCAHVPADRLIDLLSKLKERQ